MDRTLMGLVAGLIAGAAMNAWNLFDFYLLNLTQVRLVDWASCLTVWMRPTSTADIGLFLFIHLVWTGFLGVVFAHLVRLITSRHMLIKSTLYSLVLWFTFKVIINLYQVPFISGRPNPELLGGLSMIFSAVLWGIVLGLMLRALDKEPQDAR